VRDRATDDAGGLDSAYDARPAIERGGGEIAGNCHMEVIKPALRRLQRAHVVHRQRRTPSLSGS
jgi:hypothetical protein